MGIYYLKWIEMNYRIQNESTKEINQLKLDIDLCISHFTL